MIKRLLLSAIFASSIFSAGLEQGNNYKSHYISGDISVTCFSSQGTKSAYYRCSDSYLEPTIFSKFEAQGIDADKVELTYKDHKGKSRSKSSRFKNGLSTSNFNLWIWSLTQRPLLNDGENNISYKLTNGRDVVEQGVFNVLVEAMPDRQCRARSYTSNFASDCENGSNICDRYFRDENDCQ